MKKYVDLEITVRMIIPNAASRAELKEYYDDDPLRCAKELVESGGLKGTTKKEFEIVSATVKE